MDAKTGSSYIFGTMTDSMEIPMTNSGFSMMTSSIKVQPNDFDNERLQEIASSGPKRLRLHFRLSVTIIRTCQHYFPPLQGLKPQICRQNFDCTFHSFADITTSGNLAAILDLWYTSMSYDIGSTTTKKRDPENVGIAIGILSLCARELEICLGWYFYPPLTQQKTVGGKRVNAQNFRVT